MPARLLPSALGSADLARFGVTRPLQPTPVDARAALRAHRVIVVIGRGVNETELRAPCIGAFAQACAGERLGGHRSPPGKSKCGENRSEGTWVIPAMVDGYVRLHEAGAAHSLEVWCDGELVGGVYGVQVGALFAAESMFHRATDMSKVALVALVRSLFGAGIAWLDVQLMTPHLRRLGAETVRRAEYQRRLPALTAQAVDLAGLVPDWRP